MNRGIAPAAIMATALIMLIAGCGDDNSPNPVAAVSLDERVLDIETGDTYPFAATVEGGETGELNWYVDEILGGNSVVGTITRGNPAVYTAPDVVPDPDSVSVLVESAEDETKADVCIVHITNGGGN
jgi:hypothetical protein